MEKIVIIEGIDRVGKNTLINSIISLYQRVSYSHFLAPKGYTSEEKMYNALDVLSIEFKKILHNLHNHDLFIWNRGHLGEYVYGQLYRNYKNNKIFDKDSVDYMFNDLFENQIYLINLYSDDIDFLINNEDNKSLSSNFEIDKQKELKLKEINLFKDAMNLSSIKNKISINVTENGLFRNSNVILNEVLTFLKIKY